MRNKLFVFVLVALFVLAAAGCQKEVELQVLTREVPVEVTREVTREVEATREVEIEVTAAPSPTPSPTPDPMDRELADMTAGELLELMGQVQAGGTLSQTVPLTSTQNLTQVVTTEWFTATGISAQVEPLKEEAANCELPLVCNVIADPGVLGADSLEEADANPSAVWTGSWHHQLADQATAEVLIPEGSYVTSYASGMIAEVAGIRLVLPECSLDCGWGLLVRGWHEDHVPMSLTNLGSPGGMGYTRYPVPKESGQYFSYDYLTAQAQNALEFDNCGEEGCSVLYQAVLDFNDGFLGILRFTADEGWEVLWTNVQDPTP